MTKTYASTAGATAPKAGAGNSLAAGVRRRWPFSSTTCIASCRNTRPANWLRAARWRTPSPRWTLLARYNDIARAPEVFQGQSVELKEGVDRSGVSHTVPIFSPRLKQSLVSMLGGKPS